MAPSADFIIVTRNEWRPRWIDVGSYESNRLRVVKLNLLSILRIDSGLVLSHETKVIYLCNMCSYLHTFDIVY